MRVFITILALLFVAGCTSLTGSQYASGQARAAMTDRSGTNVTAKKQASAVLTHETTIDVFGRGMQR